MPAKKHLLGTLSASLGLAALISTNSLAQSAVKGLEPLPEKPPPLPEPVQSGEALEPDITIIQRGRKTIYEYRLNGRLYAIRVAQEGFPPYYLVDADGDGELESRRKELSPEFLIPQWVLFSW